MSLDLARGVPAFASLVRRELLRFARQPSRVIAAVGTAAMIWLVLGAGFAGSSVAASTTSMPLGSGSYGAYLLPGMAGMIVLFASIFAAISLIEDRNAGFLQSVLVSPAPTWSTLGARVFACGLLATAQAVPVVLAAPLVGLHMGVLGLLFSLLALGLLSAAIGAVSLLFAWKLNSVQGFHGIMNLLLMPMWLLSGAFFPLSSSAGWIRWVMLLNPMTWSMEALRSSTAGEMPAQHWLAWVGSIAFAVAALAIAHVTMRRR